MARAISLGQAGSARKDLKPSLASDIRNDGALSRTRRTVRFLSSGSSGALQAYPPPVAMNYLNGMQPEGQGQAKLGEPPPATARATYSPPHPDSRIPAPAPYAKGAPTPA